ncbi:hypothetical protein YC2023_083302 [Brassica napus]
MAHGLLNGPYITPVFDWSCLSCGSADKDFKDVACTLFMKDWENYHQLSSSYPPNKRTYYVQHFVMSWSHNTRLIDLNAYSLGFWVHSMRWTVL